MKNIKKIHSDQQILEDLRLEENESGEVIELGSVSPGQGSMFSAMRNHLTHGEVHLHNLDVFLQKRFNSHFTTDQLPPTVTPDQFDSDIHFLSNMTKEQIEEFDSDVCDARSERRASDGGGILVNSSRMSGQGPEVFAFAYDVISGRWAMTNELGFHSCCGENLHKEIMYDFMDRSDSNQGEGVKIMILSGMIYKVRKISTPIICLYGYQHFNDAYFLEALTKILSLKMFIPVHSMQIEPRKYRWCKVVTPENVLLLLGNKNL